MAGYFASAIKWDMRRHRRSSHADGPGLIGRLLKFSLYAGLLVGVAGLTWLVLTPLEAPQREVVREVSNDRLAGP
jgi:hypothetical protein